MFRELTRKKQQLSHEECIDLLKTQPRGVLAVLGDEDYPYALPMNFYYDEKRNTLFFHSGKTGHKIDALKKHPKASFCVYDQGYHKDGHWSLNIKSVVAFGTVEFVEHWSKETMVALCQKYTTDADYIQKEIAQFSDNTLVFELKIEHLTGKLVNEA